MPMLLGRSKNRRTGLISRSISFVVFLCTIGLIITSAPITMASDFTITFEEPIPAPGNVKTQYCNNPATNQGVEFKLAASRFEPSVATFSGTHALRDNPSGGDVAPLRGPMIFSFTTGQSHVGVRVGLDESHDFPVRAVLRAFDDPDPDEGTKLTPSPDPSATLGTGPAAITTPLAFSTPTGEPTIRRIEIEFLGPTGESAQEIIDDLTFSEIGPPCLVDTESPSVEILQPLADQTLMRPEELLHFTAQDLTSGVASIRVSMLASGGTELTSYFYCGGEEFPRTCPGFPSSLNVEAQYHTFLPEGTTTIRVEATDFAGNTGQDQVSVNLDLPDPNFNLWVLGIEVTQGIQNQVPSSTTSRSNFAPEASLNLGPSLVAHKRTVVRVYPGVEDTSTPVVGARGDLHCVTTLAANPFQGEPCDGPLAANPVALEITVDPANDNDLTTLRLDPSLSWNFILPQEWTEPGGPRWLIARVQAPVNLPECGSFTSGCHDAANLFVLEIPTFFETAPLIVQPRFACVRRSSDVPREDCDMVDPTPGDPLDATDAMTVSQSFLWGKDWDNDGLLDPFFNTTYPVADGINGIEIRTPILNDFIDGDFSSDGEMTEERQDAYRKKICDTFIFEFAEIFTDPGEIIATAYPPTLRYLGLIPPPVTGVDGMAYSEYPCATAKIDLANRIGDGIIKSQNKLCMICPGFTIHWDEVIVAHEIAHTFNIKHASCSHDWNSDGESDEEARGGCDPAPSVFPCPHGGICLSAAELDEPFGFNTYNMGALPARSDSTHTHDFMSYGWESNIVLRPPVWVSRHTYGRIFNQLQSALTSSLPNSNGQSPESPQPALYVSGRVEQPGNTVTIDTVYQLPMDIVAPEGSGSHSLELQRSDGEVLSRRHYDPISATDVEAGRFSHFFQLLSFPPDAARLVLKEDDQVIFERTRTANAPTLNVLEPAGGEIWPEGHQTIRWEAADLDDDPLVYTVQYSNDLSTTWKTLALNWTETTLEVDAALLAGSESDQALIRVFASDGFNSVMAESAPFTVTDKPPHVRISAPADGTVFPPQQLINLIGTAIDPEDGTLKDAAYSWDSHRDGNQGQGHELRLQTLSPGQHTITLTARDSIGNTSQDSIMIEVMGRPNTQPIADAGPNQIITTGTLIELDGEASFDPDGDSLSFFWRFISTPSGIPTPPEIHDPESATPSFLAPIAGEYVLELVVRDGAINSFPSQVVIVAEDQTFQGGVQCATFIDVPTGVLSGSVFNKNGFLFRHLPPGDLLVDDFDSAGPGLRINDGSTVLRIEWPVSALMVTVTAGSWTGASLNVSAFDGVGNQVGSTAEILPMGDVLTIGFNGQDIQIIEIVGGGNEGLLTKICIAPHP